MRRGGKFCKMKSERSRACGCGVWLRVVVVKLIVVLLLVSAAVALDAFAAFAVALLFFNAIFAAVNTVSHYSPPTLIVAQGRSARAEAAKGRNCKEPNPKRAEAARGPERSHADL